MNMRMFILFFLLASPAFAQDASPTDEIVVKAADAVMFQVNANMKLTGDQLSEVRQIVTDNIVKVRDLQQSVESGTMDSKTMYDQRQGLIEDEDRQLGSIFSPDQMKVWVTMQESHAV